MESGTNTPDGSSENGQDFIDLVDVARRVLAWWPVLLSGTFMGMALAAAYSLWLPNTYRAETVLVPAEAEQASPGISGTLGGAAALLGVNLGSSSDTSVRHALAALTSREFLGRFIEKHDLKPSLFAGTWDAATGTAGLNTEIFDASTGEWRREGGEPSDLEAYREFRRLLVVSGPDRESGLIVVAITWIDPVQARDWTNLLVSDLNAELRMDDVSEATQAIAYLRGQLESTSLVEMQRVFYQLIESQTRITMLADVREEYMFRVIDPAVAPDLKTGPRRSLISISGGVAGFAAALVLLLFMRRSPRIVRRASDHHE